MIAKKPAKTMAVTLPLTWHCRNLSPDLLWCHLTNRSKGAMSNISSFRKFCTTAGDMFAVALVPIVMLFPALFTTLALIVPAKWLGLTPEGPAEGLVSIPVFVLSYVVLIAVWLFKSYGARPGFIAFCQRNQRFGAATLWTVQGASIFWRKSVAMVAAFAKFLEAVIVWIGKSLVILLIVIIIGVIFYAFAGALSAPWWAIVIIYLLLTKK